MLYEFTKSYSPNQENMDYNGVKALKKPDPEGIKKT